MDYEKFQGSVSKPRLDKYLNSCGGSREKALKLYEANLAVAQAYYPVLNLFEVFLRNSINEQLAIYFTDRGWIKNQKTGFMADSSLGANFWMQKEVQGVEDKIRAKIEASMSSAMDKSKIKINANKIISQLSLGFWTSFFDPDHFKLVNGTVLQCFPNKPTAINRGRIILMLNRIRDFRNRIYHNQAICFDETRIDFSKAEKIRDDIFKLLEWMDGDMAKYVNRFDDIDSKIKAAHSILSDDETGETTLTGETC